MSDRSPAELRKTLQGMGAAKVRWLIQTQGLAPAYMAEAANWLAEVDETELHEREAHEQAQERLARSTDSAAWIAAVASIVAVIVGVIAVVVTVYH